MANIQTYYPKLSEKSQLVKLYYKDTATDRNISGNLVTKSQSDVSRTNLYYGDLTHKSAIMKQSS